MRYLSCFLCLVVVLPLWRVEAQVEYDDDQVSLLLTLANRYRETYRLQQEQADAFAFQRQIPVRQLTPDGDFVRIRRIESGCPIFFTTHNLNAAKTVSTDLLWSEGLEGNGILLGMWDGGDVLLSHQEFGTRIVDSDGVSPNGILWHSTAVAGTMIAAGIRADAKGMAPAAQLAVYDWENDAAEMIAAAADPGLLVSNHSYGMVAGWSYGTYDSNLGEGWYWFGDIAIDEDESVFFGRYDSDAEAFDNIMVSAPQYLIVVAAGNHRYEGPLNQPIAHYALSSGITPGQYTWVSSNRTRPLDGISDCLAGFATAKNVLTVAAVEDIPDRYSAPEEVIIWADIPNRRGSSAGPTDDGRIKPDIAANGYDLISASSAGDNQYASGSGTSFASPNTSGSLALLQERYYQTHAGSWMHGSTLKALAIHTADESGPAPGPDYDFGWGLLNSKKAADLIGGDQANPLLIQESVLESLETIEFTVYAGGSQPLRATLVWSDLPGTPPPLNQVDPNTPMLVNDLDLRIEHSGTTFYPWTLDPLNPMDPARRDRDNSVDNVEQVLIDSPQPGWYTVRITHKGTLSTGAQPYSLILSEFDGDSDFGDAPAPYPTLAAQNGAMHPIVNSLFLGSVVDGEPDGQPHALALGDDQDAPQNDEDGVVFLTPLIPGNSASLNAIANLPGLLNAWVDWNADGDWADISEHVFVDMPLVAGINPLNLAIPGTVTSGSLYARFRFSSAAGLSYDGPAPDGEVEDYALDVETDSDGDGIHDTIEGTGDRDGDGVIDALDYDPTGYLYDGMTGLILSGGSVTVSAPSGAVVTLLQNGNNGYYQFVTDGTPGTYTLQITPPAGYSLSSSCVPMSQQPFDPTGGPNPTALGSGENASTGYLVSAQCINNPYTLSFDLQPGDPWIINNNIPFGNLVPIELSSFTAIEAAGDVLLSWETQSETENLGFHIYRKSAEEKEFSQITRELIAGAGNSQVTQRYSYLDTQVFSGQTYDYQLVDIDYRGQITPHEAVRVTLTVPEKFTLLQNYPNPFNPETTIPFDLDQEGWCDLRVYNLSGQQVRILV
ncbi:S8 family serine peptidase, partial [candidate division KSB1 bacterium]|nr:S8 family serine peptidase [candidate division KSB1 bacterium]